MKLGVTGYGVVGRVTAETLRRLGHDVLIHDTDPERVRAAATEGFGTRYEADGVQVDFCCVPEMHLDEALAAMPETPLIVVRATVPPGTTDRLMTETGRSLAYMPEFLREATAAWDSMNPSFVLIGCHDRTKAALLGELFAPLMVEVIQVTPAVAEMVKLSLNAYLHTIISFWNEIHNICDRVGVPSHIVGKIASQDPRVAAYGAVMHGTPVGGHCLPKDLIQLMSFASGVGYSAALLKEVQSVNTRLDEGRSSASIDTAHENTHILSPTGVLQIRW